MRMFGMINSLLLGLLFLVSARAENSNADLNIEQQTIKTLEKLAAQLAPDMEKLGDVQSGHLGQRESKTIEIQLDRARCYKFIAVGGQGVKDLSLTVSAHGKEVTNDRITGEKPVAEWCSEGRVKTPVKLTTYKGSGTFALGVYGEKTGAKKTAEKVGGKGTDFIANRIRQLHGQFGKGRAAISSLLKGNLSTGNEKNYKIRLNGGHCYTIISAGSPSVRNLDIILYDKAGRELQQDTSRNNFPHFNTDPCLRGGGQYTLKVRMFSGFGQFGVQVFSD